MKRQFDLFHWAAVSLVAALTSAVLALAAGTPGFVQAAHWVCWVFGALAALLGITGLAEPLLQRAGPVDASCGNTSESYDLQ